MSAFLKNFYEHLNGAPKARQTLEVDYDKTRQDLQARLGRLAGNAAADDPSRVVIRPEAAASAVVAAVVVPESPVAIVAPVPASKFTEADIPQKVLASMGLTVADLAASQATGDADEAGLARWKVWALAQADALDLRVQPPAVLAEWVRGFELGDAKPD